MDQVDRTRGQSRAERVDPLSGELRESVSERPTAGVVQAPAAGLGIFEREEPHRGDLGLVRVGDQDRDHIVFAVGAEYKLVTVSDRGEVIIPF